MLIFGKITGNDSTEKLYYFPPTYNGEENHNLCCVVLQILPNLRDLHPLNKNSQVTKIVKQLSTY